MTCKSMVWIQCPMNNSCVIKLEYDEKKDYKGIMIIQTLALLPDDLNFHISFQWHSIQNRHTTAPVLAQI